jgi:hypothetical protein
MDPDRTPLRNIKNGGEPYVPSLSVLYDLDNPGPEPTLRALYDLNIAKSQVAAKMRQAWLKSGVDVVLAPAYQSCAPLHDTYGDNVSTVIWDLVDVCRLHGFYGPSLTCAIVSGVRYPGGTCR